MKSKPLRFNSQEEIGGLAKKNIPKSSSIKKNESDSRANKRFPGSKEIKFFNISPNVEAIKTNLLKK